MMGWECFHFHTVKIGDSALGSVKSFRYLTFVNNPLNLAIKSSAKSILGPVIIQTLSLGVKNAKTGPGDVTKKESSNAYAWDFRHQICL